MNCDISNWDTARKTIESLGVFDLLVNNAGVAKTQPVLEVTEDVVDMWVHLFPGKKLGLFLISSLYIWLIFYSNIVALS